MCHELRTALPRWNGDKGGFSQKEKDPFPKQGSGSWCWTDLLPQRCQENSNGQNKGKKDAPGFGSKREALPDSPAAVDDTPSG